MRSSIFSLIVILCFLNFACEKSSIETGGSVNLNTEAVNSNTKPKLSDFEENLQSMQTSDFEYIFAFRRKDGGKFDRADKDFLKENTPQQTNRWLLTKDETTVLAGSNYIFSPQILKKISGRFLVEDFSIKKDAK
jgi:hypothetical protein